MTIAVRSLRWCDVFPDHWPGSEKRFARALADAGDASVAPHARAARVYLDVSLFHPFPDGDARAARLALDYVLTANGLALHAADPIFLVARRALEEYGVYGLIFAVGYLSGPIERT